MTAQRTLPDAPARAADTGGGPAPAPGGPPGTGAPEQAAVRHKAANTLMWALLIPLAAVAAGFLSEYPFGMLYVGLVIALVVVATTVIIVGGAWNRPVAAVLASMTVLALPFFSGPTTYELYLKRLGGAVAAAVSTSDVCHAIDVKGQQEELTTRQNCHGQFRPGGRVVLFRDPLGVLHPLAEPTADRSVATGELGTSAALFALTAVFVTGAGLRRRTDAEVAARGRR